MSKPPTSFIALHSLRRGPADPARVLADIRTLYFKTTKKTIEADLAHAIALLKTLEHEDDRDKAAVYMDGLSQMRSEWATREPHERKRQPSRPRSPKA